MSMYSVCRSPAPKTPSISRLSSRGITGVGATMSGLLSVGAGAAISQSLAVDTRPLEDYHEKPQALLRIYFCFEDQFKAIVAKGGVKKLEQKKNGFLQGVPVGG